MCSPTSPLPNIQVPQARPQVMSLSLRDLLQKEEDTHQHTTPHGPYVTLDLLNYLVRPRRNTRFQSQTRSEIILSQILTIHNELHDELPAIIDALKDPNKLPGFHELYSKWFGTYEMKCKEFVQGTFRDCYESLCTRKVTYSFSSSKYCYAYSCRDDETIFLTRRFMKASENSFHGKRQIITHEITHLYGRTHDYKFNETTLKYDLVNVLIERVLSYEECVKLAAEEPHTAIENADNYGFFVDEYFKRFKMT